MIDLKHLLQKHVTLREIHGQPELWRAVFATVAAARDSLDEFFAALPTEDPSFEVLLTGAGSSAFIGESIAALWQEKTRLRTRAVATTDIVTHPSHCLPPDRPFLLVSFARSGSSPESLASIELASQLSDRAYHLIITCNKDGALARLGSRPRCQVLLLPPETNDQGLAMTGSVTSMMIAALLVADRHRLPEVGALIDDLAQAGKDLLARSEDRVMAWSDLPFERIVCLGSGPLLGTAREAQLKVQELCDSRVCGVWDSFLAFRHGPKVVLNEQALLVAFVSPDPRVARYEYDLLESLRADPRGLRMVTIDSSWIDPERRITDTAYLLPLYLIPAQLLAVHKSLRLGIDPDAPSPRGTIHRVVQGVTLYPYPG